MLKRKVQEKNKEMHEETIEKKGQIKSKVKHWIEMKKDIASGQRAE